MIFYKDFSAFAVNWMYGNELKSMYANSFLRSKKMHQIANFNSALNNHMKKCDAFLGDIYCVVVGIFL